MTKSNPPVLTEIVDDSRAPRQAVDAAALEALARALERAVLERLGPEIDRVIQEKLGRTLSHVLGQALDGVRAELTVERDADGARSRCHLGRARARPARPALKCSTRASNPPR